MRSIKSCVELYEVSEKEVLLTGLYHVVGKEIVLIG